MPHEAAPFVVVRYPYHKRVLALNHDLFRLLNLHCKFVNSSSKKMVIIFTINSTQGSQNAKKEAVLQLLLFGEPGGIRTHDLLIRSQTLYPAELRALVLSFGVFP